MEGTGNRSRGSGIDARAARRRDRRDWVSKSDLVRFLRCPYAFVQVDRGLLLPEDLVDPLSQQLIDDGNAFHEGVLADALPLPEGMDLADALAAPGTLFGIPVLRNEELKLLGAPDGVITERGALVPIEIKSHKDLRRTDLLELAFYWRVLEPYRTRQDGAPRGRMLLRRDGIPQPVDVELTDAIFDELRDLIEQVRRARRRGVKPRVCGCTACCGPLREQVARATREGKDLTMIWGIARSYAAALEELGVADYDALIDCDPRELVLGLRERQTFVSVAQVEEWRHHAHAYREAQAVIFGSPAPIGEKFIAFDLEYDPFIWLTGILISDGRQREHISLWADNPRQEKNNLLALAEIVRLNPGLPVITWSGTTADIPQLKLAAHRHRLGEALRPIYDRHIDLYLHVARTVRLPIPGLSLGETADYFGIPKTSTVVDGFQAMFMFAAYQRTRSRTEKHQLRDELTVYNRDDLEQLVGVHLAIRSLEPLRPRVGLATR
jgi:predicted RecB family nuclease